MRDAWFPWTFRRILALPGPTLRRGALCLLIPLASWVGGAMIERLVDAALD